MCVAMCFIAKVLLLMHVAGVHSDHSVLNAMVRAMLCMQAGLSLTFCKTHVQAMHIIICILYLYGNFLGAEAVSYLRYLSMASGHI